MKGIILKFIKRKNYGFILSENKTFYFTLKDCVNLIGYEIGESVGFDVQGDKAVNVHKLLY